jgi:putative mRNA 3-end processing factor
LNAWWRDNQAAGRASIVYAYSLGKAQRVLGGVDRSIGPIFAADTIREYNEMYLELGIDLPETFDFARNLTVPRWGRSLIVISPHQKNPPGWRHLGEARTAHASGWMLQPIFPAHKAVDEGFVLSDHADLNEILQAVAATGARQIYVQHGSIKELVKTLREQGYSADSIERLSAKELEQRRLF